MAQEEGEHPYVQKYRYVPQPADSRSAPASAGQVAAVFEKVAEIEQFLEVDHEDPESDAWLLPAERRMLEMLALVKDLHAARPLTVDEVGSLVESLGTFSRAAPADRQAWAMLVNELVAEAGRARASDGRDTGFVDAIERIRLLDRADAAASEAESAVRRVEEVEQKVRGAARDVSSLRLGDEYGSRAWDEERAADVLRGWAIALTVLAAGVVIAIPLGGSLEAAELFRRLAFSVPAILLAGYLARESAQHRFVARELRSAEIRLQTLGAFADGLPDAGMRAEFLHTIGTAIFTAPTPQPGDRHQASSSAHETEGLLRQLVELLRQVGAKGAM